MANSEEVGFLLKSIWNSYANFSCHENIKQNVIAYSLIIDQETYIANGTLTGTRRARPITPYAKYNGVIEEIENDGE